MCALKVIVFAGMANKLYCLSIRRIRLKLEDLSLVNNKPLLSLVLN